MAQNLLQNNADLAGQNAITATPSPLNVQGLVHVQTQSVSAGTAANFIGLAQYPYTNYQLVYSCSESAGPNLVIQGSSNNGSSYINSNYLSGALYCAYNASSYNNTQTTTGCLTILGSTLGNSATVQIFSVNTNVSYFTVNGYGCTLAPGPVPYVSISTGNYASLVIFNAFRVVCSSGTMTGTFSLYGYT